MQKADVQDNDFMSIEKLERFEALCPEFYSVTAADILNIVKEKGALGLQNCTHLATSIACK